MLPVLDTRVTFPSGGLIASAEVLAVVDLADSGRAGLCGVVTDLTPFHPVDDAWPDQGADVGTMAFDDTEIEVVDAVLGATSGANLLSTPNIPVRRGTPGWGFLVIHVVPSGGSRPAVGQQVDLRVEARQRTAISLGHTACHLAALANATLAGWVRAGASIAVEAEGPGLTDRRTWVCRLPEGIERIPCGGTHPSSLDGVAAIDVRLDLVDAELTMETRVILS